MSFLDLLWKSSLHDSKTHSGRRLMIVKSWTKILSHFSLPPWRKKKMHVKMTSFNWKRVEPAQQNPADTLTLHTRPQKHGWESALPWPPWNQPQHLGHLSPPAQCSAMEVKSHSYTKWEKHVKKLWNQGMLLSGRKDLSIVFAVSLLGFL